MMNKFSNHLNSILEEKCLDLIFIKNHSNISYITDFEPTVKNREFGLVFVSEQQQFIISPSTSYDDVKKISAIQSVRKYVEFPSVEYKNNMMSIFYDFLLKNRHLKKIGIEANDFTFYDLSVLKELSLEFVDVSTNLIKLRSNKKSQLEDLKVLGSIADELVQQCLSNTVEGVSEQEIDKASQQFISERIIQKFDLPKFDVFTMTTSGKERTVLPHTTSSRIKVKEGDHLLYCRQIRVNKIRVQCDRMGFTKSVSDKEKFYYLVVLDALKKAKEIIRPGISAKEIDLCIRQVFKNYNVEQYFIHRSGAGLGIDMAEYPLLTFDANDLIEEGMVLVIQPALYIPSIGGFRCSDTVYVTDKGSFVLTEAPRDIQDLYYNNSQEVNNTN